MNEGSEARALLLLLVAEHEATHKNCVQAISWLQRGSLRAPLQVSVDSAEQPAPASTGRHHHESVSTAPPSVTLSEDLGGWLASRSAPATNWFVLNGIALDKLLSSLEEGIQITANRVVNYFPGVYEVQGLWRRRPGVDLSVLFPANFDPDDSSAQTVLRVSHRNVMKAFLLPASSLALALDRCVRELIERGA